ncbi:hypothetical protein LXL04_028107 [Taraxacum kok-saghyz]
MYCSSARGRERGGHRLFLRFPVCCSSFSILEDFFKKCEDLILSLISVTASGVFAPAGFDLHFSDPLFLFAAVILCFLCVFFLFLLRTVSSSSLNWVSFHLLRKKPKIWKSDGIRRT